MPNSSLAICMATNDMLLATVIYPSSNLGTYLLELSLQLVLPALLSFALVGVPPCITNEAIISAVTRGASWCTAGD